MVRQIRILRVPYLYSCYMNTDKAYLEGVVKEFLEFYNKNGYLPHKAALRLIEIAELLLKEPPPAPGVSVR